MTDQLATDAHVATIAPVQAERPRIYVSCLAAYNNCYLHGRWIDATTPDEIRTDVRAMLAASPERSAEEWAIHDYENFKGANLSEYASFEAVCELADFIEEHGELGSKLLSYFGDDVAESRTAFEDYAGEYRCAADFAEQLYDDTGTEIPQTLRYYIDWESLARDMALSGDIMVFDTGPDQVHIFWSR